TLRFPSALQLGFFDDQARGVTNANGSIRRAAKGFLSRQYIGSLREDKGGTVPQTLALEASLVPHSVIEPDASDPAAFETFYSFVSRASGLMAPLYVGMTEKQTLRGRLAQHQSDIESETSRNVFGARARALGLSWSDLDAFWIAAETPSEVAVLRRVEGFL